MVYWSLRLPTLPLLRRGRRVRAACGTIWSYTRFQNSYCRLISSSQPFWRRCIQISPPLAQHGRPSFFPTLTFLSIPNSQSLGLSELPLPSPLYFVRGSHLLEARKQATVQGWRLPTRWVCSFGDHDINLPSPATASLGSKNIQDWC